MVISFCTTVSHAIISASYHCAQHVTPFITPLLHVLHSLLHIFVTHMYAAPFYTYATPPWYTGSPCYTFKYYAISVTPLLHPLLHLCYTRLKHTLVHPLLHWQCHCGNITGYTLCVTPGVTLCHMALCLLFVTHACYMFVTCLLHIVLHINFSLFSAICNTCCYTMSCCHTFVTHFFWTVSVSPCLT